MPRPPIENAEERLLAAGLNLFARLGVERVNTNAIARRARLGVGTFYSHFDDKHALLREIQNRTLAALAESRRAALAQLAEESRVVDRVRATSGAAARFARAHPSAYRVTFGRERAGLARSGPVVSESTRPTADALARLQAAGRLDPNLNVELAARTQWAAEVGLLLWWIDDPGRAEVDGIIEILSRMHPAIVASL